MSDSKMPFEVNFRDLTSEAQKQFLAWANLKEAKEGNFDVFPIASIPAYEE